MLKRTPGKWVWALSNGQPGIFIQDEDGPALTPTIGDMELMAAAPEMYELVCRIAVYESYIDTKLVRDAQSLVKRINVERQDKRR